MVKQGREVKARIKSHWQIFWMDQKSLWQLSPLSMVIWLRYFLLCISPMHMITEMTIQGTMVRSDRVVGANNVGPTSPLQPNKDIPLRICLVVQDPTLTEESNQSRWKISLKLPDGISFAQKCNWTHCVLSLMKEGDWTPLSLTVWRNHKSVVIMWYLKQFVLEETGKIKLLGIIVKILAWIFGFLHLECFCFPKLTVIFHQKLMERDAVKRMQPKCENYK